MRTVLASSYIRVMVRFGMPLLILGACALLLGQQISHDVLIALPDQLRDITFVQWALAALCTAGSFWAVGQYDRPRAHHRLL